MKLHPNIGVSLGVLAIALVGAGLISLRYPARLTPPVVVSSGPILPQPDATPQSFDTKAGLLYVNHADTVNNYQGFLTDADRLYLMGVVKRTQDSMRPK